MKKILVVLLILPMLLSMTPVAYLAADMDTACHFETHSNAVYHSEDSLKPDLGDTYGTLSAGADGGISCTDHKYGECVTLNHNIRQFTCTVCEATTIFERIQIPVYYSGNIYVEENSSGFYYGTRNVADLLELKSGTYTNGQVTISIDGTNIAVNGTPDKNLYFDLQTGRFGTPDYLRDPGYTLPDGDYRMGLIGSGSVFPTMCIRNSDGKGNQISTASVRNASGLSGANFGIPYLYLPKDKSYDFSGNLILNMGTDQYYDGDVAHTTKIEDTGIYKVNGYMWSPNDSISVFAEQDSRDTGKITYMRGSKEYINVYLPGEVGYLQIQMNLANNASTNAYGWRLNMMYACDDRLTQVFPITYSGEYEAAIKLNGRPDFMGMGIHGSERMTSFAMYVDGTKVELSQLSNAATDWKTITMIRESDFYDPLDEATVVATHTVTYEFDLDGLTVTQDVNWIVDSTCATSYMMMFPVRRVYQNLQITDTYFDNFDTTEYDVSTPGFTTYPYTWTKGATMMTLYSEKSGITASMKSIETPVLTGAGYKHCANSENYNKLYFTVCGGVGTKHQVLAGDHWHTQHRYEVSIGTGTDVDPCTFGHRYTAVITPPTCTERGYTTYTCACGDSYADNYVGTIGHSYVNGICTVCSAIQPPPAEEIIIFRIGKNEFTAVKGMTWAEWIRSFDISAGDNGIVWIGYDGHPYMLHGYLYYGEGGIPLGLCPITLDGVRIRYDDTILEDVYECEIDRSMPQ